MLRLSDLAVFLGLTYAELLIRSLPPRAAVAVAEGFGRLWYVLDGRRRSRARESLRIAERGGLAVDDRETLVRRSFRALMHVPLEVMVFPRYFRSPRDTVRRCRFFGDWPLLKSDVEQGRGGFFVSGHLGSWELAAWLLEFMDVHSRVVARPIENPWLERRAIRTRGGPDRVISKRGAAREVLRTLKAHGWVGIMGDQNAGAGGAFVPFFGLPASTYRTPAVMAQRTGVPVYAAASLRRQGEPFTYDIYLRRLPEPEPGASEDEAVAHTLETLMETLEGWVRLAPEQYNWVHRRWKSRPKGEAPAPHLPRYDRRTAVPV